jgi:hypothetical protein
MDGKTTATLIVTIALAFISYIVKYLNDLAIARRKDQLDRINSQLRNLYGPLYAIDQATDIAWKAFRSRYRRNCPFFGTSPPPTEDDLAAWRLWMLEVLMPLNLIMEKAIVENADLIIENEMPACFLKLIAHTAAYKPVLRKWKDGDYSEHLSLSVFPTDLRPYVESAYLKLKNDRATLIGKRKSKLMPNNGTDQSRAGDRVEQIVERERE